MGKSFQFATFLLLVVVIHGCSKVDSSSLSSPDGDVVVLFTVQEGSPTYSLTYRGEEILRQSSLGFQFKNTPALNRGLEITRIRELTKDETWTPVWGAFSRVRNHFNGMTVHLREKSEPHRKLDIEFRVFNDGIGFRYHFPEQGEWEEFEIISEETEFRFARDHTCWWQIANYDSYEYTFVESPLSELGEERHAGESEYGWPAFGESVPGAANTPIVLRTDKGTYLSIHEADLTDYAGMTLKLLEDRQYTLKSELVPWPDGEIKVKADVPHQTPWRTIQIGDRPGGLIESSLIQNLNDPCALEDTEWITPAKYCGIWWSLHIGKESWRSGPKHGANTENILRYIDFAAENSIPHVLAEGWNKYGPLGADGGKVDFITPADDCDLEKVLRYAEERAVKFMWYNETGGQVEEYRSQWDTTFAFYRKHGISAIKAGHIGDRLAGEYHHHSQWGVNYFQDLIEKTAGYQILLMVHEPVKPTGKMRTYPHYLTREGVAGMEQDKFEYADPREHTVEVPFIRMLAGPLDYMPGIFDNRLEDYEGMQVQSTVARQLAYYPVFLSGLQCVTDLPENYQYKPAFQFIRDVPVTWDETRVLGGEIGDFITIARRSGNEWYVGSLTDEEPRTLAIPLQFLEEGSYTATVYADGPGAHAVSNPDPVRIEERTVTGKDTLTAAMVSGGGYAVRITPAE